MKRIIFLLLLAMLAGGCQSNVTTTPLPTIPDATSSSPTSISTTVQSTPEITVQPPTPTSPPPHKKTSYTLKAKFNFGLRTLTVDEAISYTNNSTDTLNELVLMVEPNNYPGAFNLTKFTFGDGKAVIGYTLNANILRFPLSQPLASAQDIQVNLNYVLQLPAIPPPADDQRPVPFGYTDRQVNLVDWYPYFPPYIHGSGWLAHKPWFYGEHQVYEMSDFQVEIDLVSPPKDLVIAASGASAAASQNGNTYTYTQSYARNFVWSASPYYKLATQQVGQVTVSSYAFTFDTVAGKAALQYTAQALELYSKLFTPYTHTSLTVVEADFLDGMEYDGLYFLSRGFYNLYGGNPQGYLAAIAAHETSHQWWYAQLMDDQALEPWLDEAMATYCEYIFYSHLYPEYLKWWWDYRVDYYDPAGKINLQLYDYTSYLSYRNAVYLNGAHFLDDLRTLIGDNVFYSFLHNYAVDYAGKLVTAADFFNELKKTTSADISALKSKYFQ
jgi:hypothetical protein